MKQIVRFISKFGFWSGIKLYFKFITGKVEHVKLPHLRHSFSLRKNTSDIPTFYKVFFYNEYDLSFVKKPKVIIDGGSNVGLFAIKMKNEFPDSKIICIEPDVENFRLAKKNLSSYNNVFVENCGLWNKDAKLKVYDKFNLGKWGMVVEEVSNDCDVEAVCLKSLLKKYSIDYIDVLKLDIETSEKILFSKNYEEWLPKVKTIIIELHDWVEEGCSKPFFEAINKSFNKYSYFIKGENTIIANNDLT